MTGVEQRRSLAAASAAVERRQASAPEALVRGNTNERGARRIPLGAVR